MLKPLTFLFLFQIIISKALFSERIKSVSSISEEEVKENEKKEICKSIDGLFANHDINKNINDNFQDEFVKLNENVKKIPENYKNGLLTPLEYMISAKFSNPIEHLEVKIFKKKEESLEFVKNDLVEELKEKGFNLEQKYLRKLGDLIKEIDFTKNAWKKVDLITPRRKLQFLSIFFQITDNNQYAIVYYYLNSYIIWKYESFVIINKSINTKNCLNNDFDTTIYKQLDYTSTIYKDILIRYFSIFSYNKIHKTYGEGDFYLPEMYY